MNYALRSCFDSDFATQRCFTATPFDVRNGYAFPGDLEKTLWAMPSRLLHEKSSPYRAHSQGVARKKAIHCAERHSHSAHQAAEPKI